MMKTIVRYSTSNPNEIDEIAKRLGANLYKRFTRLLDKYGAVNLIEGSNGFTSRFFGERSQIGRDESEAVLLAIARTE